VSNVLLIGESWFSYTIHQKGFDAFYSSTYTEGGGDFLTALQSKGHTTSYIPAHKIDSELPGSVDELDQFDVIVISDVGANSFLLPAQTFVRSEPAADKTEQLRRYVAQGGALLMIGGYLSFSGIEAKARWGHSRLASALPVEVLDRDDRVELPAGARPTVVAGPHPILDGLPGSWPLLLGLNELRPRAGAEVLLECEGLPLLILGEHGRGRSAAFASDIAPHWAPPAFLQWPGYPILWDQLVRWLAKEV
jgi:uncharacterized membrane protein